MGSLDPAKILIILLIALVVLGPERLPKMARQMGGFWRDLGKFREKMEQEVRGAMPDLDLPPIPVIPKGGVAGYLTGLMTSTSSSSAVAGAGGAVTEAAGVAAAGGDFAIGGPAEVDALNVTGWQHWETQADGVVRTTSGRPGTLAEGIPAGWQSVGAASPGYASGSLLSPVPSGGSGGERLDAEASFTFDEPSWN